MTSGKKTTNSIVKLFPPGVDVAVGAVRHVPVRRGLRCLLHRQLHVAHRDQGPGVAGEDCHVFDL